MALDLGLLSSWFLSKDATSEKFHEGDRRLSVCLLRQFLSYHVTSAWPQYLN